MSWAGARRVLASPGRGAVGEGTHAPSRKGRARVAVVAEGASPTAVFSFPVEKEKARVAEGARPEGIGGSALVGEWSFGGALRRMARAPGGALLVTVGLGHVLLGVLLATWMLAPAEPLLGVHPALKPFKFAVSIAGYVLTMAWILPRLTLTERVRLRVARIMASVMLIEMVAILGQALRGVPSHFNITSWPDAMVWNLMGAAITVASGIMVYLAWVSVKRPLTEHDGRTTAPSLAYALRAALILAATSAVSGFSMGQLMRHSIGGKDGGAGLPLTNWSTAIGDLRVAHFFQLHALQVLPLVALVVTLVTAKESVRMAVVRPLVWLYAAFCVGTFAQALLGLPLFGA